MFKLQSSFIFVFFIYLVIGVILNSSWRNELSETFPDLKSLPIEEKTTPNSLTKGRIYSCGQLTINKTSTALLTILLAF